MKRSVFQVAIIILVIAGVGPAAEKLREKLIGYEQIEVTPMKNKVGENLDQATLNQLQEAVVARINESKLFKSQLAPEPAFPGKDPSDDTKVVYKGTGSDEDGKTLVLFAEIITFNKGSRAKRYALGGGTGRAELRGNCYLVDKKTGNQLYYFQTFGETNWGLFGGGSDKTLKGFAGRIVDFLKGKY